MKGNKGVREAFRPNHSPECTCFLGHNTQFLFSLLCKFVCVKLEDFFSFYSFFQMSLILKAGIIQELQVLLRILQFC